MSDGVFFVAYKSDKKEEEGILKQMTSLSKNAYSISGFSLSNVMTQQRGNEWDPYGTPEGTFLFQYLPEKKSKQKELGRKSKQ